MSYFLFFFFFFSSRRRHTRFDCDWSSDVCSSDLPTLHFRTHDATLHATRLDRGDLHLPAHHPRRHRPNHRIGTGLRRALAALQWQAAPAARPPDDDRVWAPAGGGGREWVGDGARGVRVVAATGGRKQGAVLSRPN